MRIIHVDTKLVGLIGTPLRQSFSPIVQNAVYEELGSDYFYLAMEVKEKENLGAVMEAVRVMNFAGLAVTKPYKVDIMAYLDEVDGLAMQIGSCNTVVVMKDGRLKGYNTDGIGAIASLELEGGVRIAGKTFFSFGSGGTGKSVCLELAARGAKKIYIASRSSMCEELAAHINALFPGVCRAIRMAQTEEIHAAVANADVLLNLSGLGMYPHSDETPLAKFVFKPNHICFDATYNPRKTLFLKDAEAAGCKIINGLGMLAYQGTRQIHLWTGLPEPVELMLTHLQRVVDQ